MVFFFFFPVEVCYYMELVKGKKLEKKFFLGVELGLGLGFLYLALLFYDVNYLYIGDG